MTGAADIEEAIRVALANMDAPITVDDAIRLLSTTNLADYHRRGRIAFDDMFHDGRLRFTGCDHGKGMHDGTCVIELAEGQR